ncbi:MAG: hypothetical protein FRX48_01716 [Lasallia pustulata]|uniref:Cns1/TTC4 wheel domain-containing protein n=1 Tax=Lasallia pustulata TaxID=136370 RepID=A0A5M8Q0S4_9LECA|nr:MAG: hypothetical protein FRX48_01716 [Lasallia pustulata]
MPRVEELPDDHDDSQTSSVRASSTRDLEIPQPQGLSSATYSQSTPVPLPADSLTSNGTSTTPSLPPQMASVKAHSVDEIVDLMTRTPLFMTDLSPEALADNPELDAIRALQYEGTRAEVAQGFRESGNECARGKAWKDAKEFYTKALAALRAERNEQESGLVLDEEEEGKKEREIKEACYINRALCNLELKNYRQTTLDCAHTLQLNAKNVKAHYRSAQALLSLSRLDEALDICTRGLTLDPTNGPLKALLAKITAAKDLLDEQERKRQEREMLKKRKEGMLKAALMARMIRTRTTGQPPEMEDTAIKLVPDPLSPTSTLVFPVVLLYPLHLQSDFIKAFGEEQTLGGHLEYLLPLPWDEKGEYTDVEAYMETVAGGLVKVGKKVPLLKVLSGGKVEVVDEIVRINVVPKARAAEWIEEVKRRKGKA